MRPKRPRLAMVAAVSTAVAVEDSTGVEVGATAEAVNIKTALGVGT